MSKLRLLSPIFSAVGGALMLYGFRGKQLIDADALIKQIEKNKCEPCKIRGHDRKGLLCRFCQYGDEMDDIYDAPTIEERKKGKWIPFDNPWYKCSECGAVRENKSFMENFCPNCGADMRGGEDEVN